mgnify:CR=1 FL=1
MHTPGHSPGHAAFYILEDNDLISGDTVLGYGTTFFRDLYDYMRSLRTMLAINPRRLLPGHGPVVLNATDYVSRYISHRSARTDQVVEVLETFSYSSNSTISTFWLVSKFFLPLFYFSLLSTN